MKVVTIDINTFNNFVFNHPYGNFYQTSSYGSVINKFGLKNLYLGFVDEKTRDMLMAHINDHDIHVTLQEKLFWNNKINIDDSEDITYDELSDETLILNRN